MRISIIIIVAIVAFYGSVFAQHDEIKVDFQILEEEIGVIDPIFYSLRIENTSSSDKNILRISQVCRNPTLEFRLKGETDWHIIPSTFSNNYTLSPSPQRTLTAGEVINVSSAIMAYNPATLATEKMRSYCFSKVGIYELRARFYLSDNEFLYSSVREITLSRYSGEDYEAFSWLKQQRIPHFVYYAVVGARAKGFDKFEKAKEFNDKFTNTRFNDWASLISIYDLIKHSEGNNEALKKAESLIENTETNNPEVKKYLQNLTQIIKNTRWVTTHEVPKKEENENEKE